MSSKESSANSASLDVEYFFTKVLPFNEDIAITKEKPPQKFYYTTNSSSKNTSLSAEELTSDDAHTKDCVDVYSKDLTFVNYKYAEFGGRKPIPSTSNVLSDFPELSYEIDGEFYQESDKDKTEKPLNLFDLFTITEKELSGSDPRVTAVKPFELARSIRSKFQVEIKELAFGLGETEPLFLSLLVFDMRSKKRVTETFRFQQNSDFSFTLIGAAPDKINPLFKAKEAVISLTECDSNYFIILIVEKVLQGAPDDYLDNYFKYQTLKPKDKTKIQEQIRLFCNKLGKYRQALAWGTVELFDESGDFIFASTGEAKKNQELFEIAVELNAAKGEYLPLYANADEDKKPKVIPGTTCKLVLKKITENTPVDESVVKFDGAFGSLVPMSNINFSKVKIQRQLEEFWYDEDAPNAPKKKNTLSTIFPQTTYSNTLYIYPLIANLSSTSGRNVAVRVTVLDSDELDAKPLPVIHGDGSISDTLLVNNYYSSICYHKKKPTFFDEIKIQIPLDLT